MSIEDKIEDLSVTINNLTSAINVMIEMVNQAQPTKEKKPTPPVKEKEKEKEKPTHDDLKHLCIKVNREDNANHAKIKALIASYDAKKVGDLSDEQVQLVHAKLLAGEF